MFSFVIFIKCDCISLFLFICMEIQIKLQFLLENVWLTDNAFKHQWNQIEISLILTEIPRKVISNSIFPFRIYRLRKINFMVSKPASILFRLTIDSVPIVQDYRMDPIFLLKIITSIFNCVSSSTVIKLIENTRFLSKFLELRMH